MKPKFVKLHEVAETCSGGTPSRGNKNFYGGSIPWIKSGELPDGEITFVEEKITQLALENSSAKLLPEGTLLIAMYGATVGKLGILTFSSATNQAVCAIILSKHLDRDYLFNWLLYIRKNLIEASFGGAQPNISQTVIRNLEIPIYPIDKQRQIATRLKVQLSEVEKARKAAEVQLQEINSFVNRIIESRVLNAMDTGAEVVKLGDIAKITAKLVNPELPEFCNLPHVSAENIESITGRLIGVRSAKEDGMSSGKYLFSEGDILYSKLRPYLRKVALPDFSGLCSADMYPLKCNPKKINSNFLQLLLTSNLFTDYANEKSARSRMPKLNREQLFEWEFKLPSLTKQLKCVEFINLATNSAEKATSGAKSTLSDLSLLPQKILAQAFEI